MASSRTIVIEGIKSYGLTLAQLLSKRRENVYLLDEDKILCEEVVGSLSLDGIVLNGKVVDGILDKENMTEFDVFVAAHDDDDKNFSSCLYIKDHRYKVDQMLAIVQNGKFEEYVAEKGILTVSPERAVAKILLRYMAGDPKLTERITSTGETELMPIKIEPGSRLDGKKISTIHLKLYKDYTIVGVCREKNKEGERIIMADENHILEAGDILQLHIHPRDHKKLLEYINK
ncbi:TrkA family potassium uptake protein [Candidatus Woesearchaeota archaeon]|nr:TrkA family potassium uptake protein [Candidatus Woesearchaeota archaeon]